VSFLRRRWPLLLAVALLLGSVAAFSYTEKLKLTRSPVGVARFDGWLSPGCDCRHEVARLSFLLRKPERVHVTIVDADGDEVRRLASNFRRPAGRIALEWDGRDEAGGVVPDGAYRVRVRLLEERRTIVIPVEVRVDTEPPRVTDAGVDPVTVAPGEEVVVTFTASEFGTPVLLVDGEIARRGPAGRPGERTLAWTTFVPGSYEVAVAVEDRAGNLSEPAGATTVVVTGAPR